MLAEGIAIGKGEIDGKGVYATRNFRKGEVVIHYSLTRQSEEGFEKLPPKEREAVHTHWGVKYLYSIPERYVNHSSDPNTLPDLKNTCDVAIRDIEVGEQVTTDASKDDV